MAGESGASEQADLAALADGSLTPRRRREVEARVAASPGLQAALARQRSALAAVRATEEERAPAELRGWLAEHGAGGAEERDAGRRGHPAARRSPAGPGRSASWRPLARPRRTAVACALVVVVSVVAALALVASPGASDVAALAAAAGRPASGPAPAPARAPGDDLLLSATADGIAFPDWQPRLGWRATGLRADEVAGRRAVTVHYARDGRRFAYAILARPALDLPGEGRYRPLVHDGRPAVAWIRDGRTCLLLAGAGVGREELRALAASTRFY